MNIISTTCVLQNAVVCWVTAHAMAGMLSCRSDQPTWHASTPSTSPSTRLSLIEHRVAAASPLRAAAPPPLVRATGCQCALPGVYAPVASRRCPDSRPAATPPLGPWRRRTQSTLPPPRTDAPGNTLPGKVSSPPGTRSPARSPRQGATREHAPRQRSPGNAPLATSAQGLRHAAGYFLAYFMYCRRAPAAGLADHHWSPLGSPTTTTPSRRPA